MAEEDDVDFQAFCEFSELGFEDYVIELDWEIQAPLFPFSKHTSGDVQIFKNTNTTNTISKVFKTYNLDFLNKKIENLQHEELITNPNNYYQEGTTVKNNYYQEGTTVNQIITEVKETVVENLVEEIFKNSEFHEQIENKTEQHVSSITEILNLKIEESNNLTVEQINQLESNLNLVNNNFVTNNQIKKLEEKIVEQNDNTKKELKQEIDSNKDFFIKFLNS